MVAVKYNVTVTQVGVYAESRSFDSLKEAKAWGMRTAQQLRRANKYIDIRASIYLEKYHVWDDGTWSYEGYEKAFILTKINSRHTWRLM